MLLDPTTHKHLPNFMGSNAIQDGDKKRGPGETLILHEGADTTPNIPSEKRIDFIQDGNRNRRCRVLLDGAPKHPRLILDWHLI